MRRAWQLAIALTAAATVSPAHAQASAPSSPSAGLTKPKPYRIGYLVDASGTEQATIRPPLDGLNLYIARLNRSGGVNGRPVEIVVRDTRSNLQRSLDAVGELSRSGVSGIAGLGISSTHGAVYAAAQKVALPVIAAFPANTPFVLPPARPNAFGVGLAFNVTGVVGGRLARTVSPDGKRLVCVAFESSGSVQACDTVGRSARAAGFTQVDTLTVPVGHADFRVIVDRINALKPDVVTDCLGRAQVMALLPALTASPYQGVFLSMDSAIGEQVLRDGTPRGSKVTVYSYGRYVSGNDGDGEQVRALREAAAAAGIAAPDASHAAGWVMGLVLRDALQRCPGDCDGPQLNAALESVDVDTGGLTAQRVRFTHGDHYGPTAYRLYRFDADTRTFAAVGDWIRIGSDGHLLP